VVAFNIQLVIWHLQLPPLQVESNPAVRWLQLARLTVLLLQLLEPRSNSEGIFWCIVVYLGAPPS
jgi:hypothetical protein